jgi:hypothetical protein
VAELNNPWKIHHLQPLGIPLQGLGAIPVGTLTELEACGTPLRNLFWMDAQGEARFHEKLSGLKGCLLQT